MAIETSKTHRLYVLLKERIISGALRPGERLASEPRLAAAHHLSRVTIRRVLDGLARDGLITRQPGSGTFVRDTGRQPVLSGDFSNLLHGLVAMGRATHVRLLAFSYVEPPPAIATALGLEAGELAQHALRVRSSEGVPFSYLSTYVPRVIGERFTRSDLAVSPLLMLLERSGVTASAATQTVSATLAGPESAAALEVEIGAPLLSLTRVVSDLHGRAIEHLTALYRPDRYCFHMALAREGEGQERYWRPAAQAGRQARERRETATRRRRT